MALSGNNTILKQAGNEKDITIITCYTLTKSYKNPTMTEILGGRLLQLE
jgi:hypothetical protein